MEKKLEKLYDKNSLYNEVIKELQGFPPKDWMADKEIETVLRIHITVRS